MKSIWTRGVRPRIHSSCTIHPDSCSGILARRTASAPTRRRLQLKDAFTILLAPVLTAAFVVDVTGKDRRRKHWESRITEVLAEIEVLREDERRRWRALQQRTPGRTTSQQRRGYATAAHAFAGDVSEHKELEEPSWDEEPQVVDPYPDSGISNTHGSDASEESMEVMRHYRRLLAMRMAMQLVFNIHTSTSPRFSDNAGCLHDELQAQPTDLNVFAQQLREFSQALNSFDESPVIERGRHWSEASQESRALDSQIKELSSDVRTGRVTWASYTMTIAQSILKSTGYPTLDGYFNLFRAYTRAGLTDLAYEVINTLRAGQNCLNPSLIYDILIQYGRKKDAFQLDRFLRILTKISRPDAPHQEWKWKHVNGTRFACPVDSNPGILQALIFAALRCEQHHKAEAIATLMLGKGLAPERISYLIINFLNHYAAIGDWISGAAWLKVLQQEIADLATHSIHLLQRVIFVLLNFCVVCDRRQLYAAIVDAIAAAHIGPPARDTYRPVRVGSGYKAIRTEWEHLYMKHLAASDVGSDAMLALTFQESLKGIFKSFGVLVDTTVETPPDEKDFPTVTWVPQKSILQRTISTKNQKEADSEFTSIRRQLDTIKKLLESQPARLPPTTRRSPEIPIVQPSPYSEQSHRPPQFSQQSQRPPQIETPTTGNAVPRNTFTPLTAARADPQTTSDTLSKPSQALDAPFLRDLRLRIAHVCKKQGLDDEALTASVMQLVSAQASPNEQVLHLNLLSSIFRLSDRTMLSKLQEYVGFDARPAAATAAKSESLPTEKLDADVHRAKPIGRRVKITKLEGVKIFKLKGKLPIKKVTFFGRVRYNSFYGTGPNQ